MTMKGACDFGGPFRCREKKKVGGLESGPISRRKKGDQIFQGLNEKRERMEKNKRETFSKPDFNSKQFLKGANIKVLVLI
jgi:hypothetical protein